jgi:hypothetical protein
MGYSFIFEMELTGEEAGEYFIWLLAGWSWLIKTLPLRENKKVIF